jgi:hypothetical protein
MHHRAPRRVSQTLVRLLALAVVAVIAAACSGAYIGPAAPVTGTGDPAEQDRTAGAFTAISVSGGIKVVVAVGAGRAVSLTAQRNLLPLISTDIVESRLTVTIPAPGINATKPITLRVTLPVLTRVTLDGGSTGTMEIDTDALEVNISGGSSMTAIGRAGALTLTADGGSTAELEELHAETAAISINGGSTAVLDVSTALTGTADGGSTVRLIQKPATQNVKANGGSTVTGP